jgi:hypothetical protein
MSLRFAFVLALVSFGASVARADLAHFVDVPGASGTFEWDTFVSPSPFAPDVRQVGGTAQLSTPAGPIVTGTNNIYSGFAPNTNVTITAAATPSQTSGPLTTYAFQLGFDSAGNLPNAGSFLLNGSTAPTDFLYRGIGGDGTHYYWAEYVGVATLPNVTLQYSAGPHVVLRGSQIDYVNGSDPVNLANPGLVPEPAGAALAALALAAFAVRRRKR